METATHFANCPRWDQLWKGAQMVMDIAGMPVVVRAWFVLYGPEAAAFRRDQYDTAVWIWAAIVARMLQARRDSFGGTREPRNSKQLVIGFRSLARARARHRSRTGRNELRSNRSSTMGWTMGENTVT